MSVAAGPHFDLDDSFARELVGLHEPWAPASVADPSLLVLNEALATEIGLDPDSLRSPDAVAVLAGNATPGGVTTVAQAYAGHQFGGYSPRLGDGRALAAGRDSSTTTGCAATCTSRVRVGRRLLGAATAAPRSGRCCAST